MNERLAQLRSELEKGRQEMTRLDQRRQTVRDTLLRISGAIQVLEELEGKNGRAADEATPAAVST